MLQRKTWAIILLLVAAGLGGVLMMRTHHQDVSLKTGKVAWKTMERSVDYYAALAPKTATWVASPVTGHVERMPSGFGEMVKVGQVLMELEDPKIQEGYVSSVTDYLQAKDALKRSKKTIKGEASLLDLGAISQKDYDDVQRTYEKNYLAWLKARLHLTQQLALVHIDFAAVDKLKFSDLDQIEAMLAPKKSVMLTADAPGLLLPAEGGDKKETVKEGSKVKGGDVVAMIVPKCLVGVTLLQLC